MAESVFRFKQFSILQKDEVMKVGIDGVLLGAFADFSDDDCILDIGTGTGLIALMAAQKNSFAKIHALEKEKAAFDLASENIKNSPQRLQLLPIHDDFTNYSKVTPETYSHIVCNPPFYKNGLLPQSAALQSAKHIDELRYPDLILGVKKLLKASGRFSLILPACQAKGFNELCQRNSLYLQRLLKVFPTPDKAPKRMLMTFGLNETEPEEKTLIIESDGRHNYSPEYKKLTKDFYLNF
jgi:tRNA1Val (adenine37-N6)-methyltransferase